MNKNFTFGFEDLKRKIGPESTAVRKIPVRARASARFYYTCYGELRGMFDGTCFAWKRSNAPDLNKAWMPTR